MRVLIADDHPLFRDGLARAVSARFELVAAVGDGRSALEQIRSLQPDVAVLDLRMPELSGLDVIAAVDARVLVLSAARDSALVYAAVAAGAAGYWSKEADRDTICDAIATVARGETVLGADIQSAVAQAIREREPASGPVLSPREREVLRLTADGRSAPQIAAELYLSPTTVKTHLQRIYEKLGVSDRAAAVREAMRRGLIE